MTKKGWMTILAIVLIAGAVFGLNYAKKTGVLDKVADKVAPAGKQTADMSAETKKAVKEGMPMMTVCINTWGGYAPGVYYNGGLISDTSSRYYKDGIIVKFVLIQDVPPMRNAFTAKECNVMGLVTIDSLPVDIVSLMTDNAEAFLQTDWSRGGDVVVAIDGINTPKDAIGKEVALAIGSPSHALFLVWLKAGGVRPDQVTIVATDSGGAAAKMFQAGKVPIAVTWSPDDQDCLKAIPGSKIIFDTKKAKYAVADVLMVNGDFAKKNPEVMRKFVKGWLTAAAEINSNSSAKENAANMINDAMGINSLELARLMIENARLTTYGDNLEFFGLKPTKRIVGEELYNKMLRLFSEMPASLLQIDVAKVPAWRSIINTSFLSNLNLYGPGHEAEGADKFSAPTTADVKAPIFAEKAITVNFKTNSAVLSEQDKLKIRANLGDTSKEFSGARVRIEGNTDSTGNYDHNKQLSFDRAHAVANYLVSQYGFDKDRFVIVGNGPDKPVPGCDNDTQKCLDMNRRTDFMLLAN